MNLNFLLRASLATFGAYFCMYAFRKPFTVASFQELSYFGIDYKVLLIIFQVLGYTLSKFIGIKVISEMKPNKRRFYLVGFILCAELALLGFAIVPAPYNILFLFLNGLPLGMIWGIVFSYIEGRKVSELLGVILSSSFIVSSGAVKSVGKIVLDSININEFWMPFVTGTIFIIPLLFFAWMLEKLEPPTAEDKLLKTERKTLSKLERKKLFKQFFFPLICIVVFYTLLTSVRDFRDNFAREIWASLGYENASIFSISEIPIAIIVLVTLGYIGSIAKNYKAFMYYNYLLIAACFLIIISTYLYQNNIITPLTWMIVSGLGLYSSYVPFNGIFFDRMIATYKVDGNVGFLIYIADAFGYLGSILILLYKNFGQKDISWLTFFVNTMYVLGFLGLILTISCYYYFKYKNKKMFNKLPVYE